jgi:hypothetical protein
MLRMSRFHLNVYCVAWRDIPPNDVRRTHDQHPKVTTDSSDRRRTLHSVSYRFERYMCRHSITPKD